MSIRELSQNYYLQRGFNISGWGRPTGKKMMEEAAELLEANAIDSVKFDEESFLDVLHEVADVAICLDYIAQWHGFTIEDAIKRKTMKDKGRGDKVNPETTAKAL